MQTARYAVEFNADVVSLAQVFKHLEEGHAIHLVHVTDKPLGVRAQLVRYFAEHLISPTEGHLIWKLAAPLVYRVSISNISVEQVASNLHLSAAPMLKLETDPHEYVLRCITERIPLVEWDQYPHILSYIAECCEDCDAELSSTGWPLCDHCEKCQTWQRLLKERLQ